MFETSKKDNICIGKNVFVTDNFIFNKITVSIYD